MRKEFRPQLGGCLCLVCQANNVVLCDEGSLCFGVYKDRIKFLRWYSAFVQKRSTCSWSSTKVHYLGLFFPQVLFSFLPCHAYSQKVRSVVGHVPIGCDHTELGSIVRIISQVHGLLTLLRMLFYLIWIDPPSWVLYALPTTSAYDTHVGPNRLPRNQTFLHNGIQLVNRCSMVVPFVLLLLMNRLCSIRLLHPKTVYGVLELRDQFLRDIVPSRVGSSRLLPHLLFEQLCNFWRRLL